VIAAAAAGKNPLTIWTSVRDPATEVAGASMIGRRISDAATRSARNVRAGGPGFAIGLLIGPLVGLLVASAACGGNDRASPDASIPPNPDAAQVACPSSGPVSFKTDVAPLIGHCSSGDGCHGVIGRLMTWPYQALVNVVAADCTDQRVIVKPGDPSASYLVDKLLGVDLCSGARMPLRGTPLSDASMATIEAWICQGAANN
jgi:hypothetical protein